MALTVGEGFWRRIIAEDFTFSNVRRVAQAISDYLIESGEEYKGVAVGYDTRFMSERFAKEIAYVLSKNDIPVFLTIKSTPTPVVSLAVKTKGAAMGVVVTASHNPPEYNGLKLKASYGGPVTLEITNRLQKYLERPFWRKYGTIEIRRTDGIKFLLENRYWLLLRLSGTEPLLRVYSEANNQKLVQELLIQGQEIVKNLYNI